MKAQYKDYFPCFGHWPEFIHLCTFIILDWCVMKNIVLEMLILIEVLPTKNFPDQSLGNAAISYPLLEIQEALWPSAAGPKGRVGKRLPRPQHSEGSLPWKEADS